MTTTEQKTTNASAYADGGRVFLTIPRRGCHEAQWVDLYTGPEPAPENIDSDAVQGALLSAKGRASQLAERWRGMSFEQAKAEFDAL